MALSRGFRETGSSFMPLFRLLDDFTDYNGHIWGYSSGLRLPPWQPRFDVRETAENYELHGELPGIRKENVHIEFTEPQTIIVRGTAERTYEEGTKSAKGVKFWLAERSIGDFFRSFNLLKPVNQSAVSASFKDGILTVVIPKVKGQALREIAIA